MSKLNYSIFAGKGPLLLGTVLFIVFFISVCVPMEAGATLLGEDNSYENVNNESNGEVFVITLEDQEMITAGTASFVRRQIKLATEADAEALVIMMDTPGGLVDATLELNRVIRGAPFPVIVYVAPVGAIAASAGAFLLLSGDIAAMASGTTVGAAQPVAMTPDGSADPAEDKTTELLAGHIRSIAKETDRPEDVAGRFVTENLTLRYDEAIEKEVADLQADSLQELLTEIDGWEIQKGGEKITLETANAPIRNVQMDSRESFQNWVSNPQIAFILLMLGIMGLYFGLSMPGTLVPEVAGGLMLVLGIYGMGLFDTSTTGIVLLVLGVALIVAEVFTTGFGFLGIGGAVALLVGAILLPIEPLMAQDWYETFITTVFGIVIGVAIIMLVVVQRLIASRRNRREEAKFFYGPERAEAVDKLPPSGAGVVKVRGELWKARNTGEEEISPEEKVKVVGQEGLILLVELPYEDEKN